MRNRESSADHSPVQVVHRRPGASVSAVAAVVGVVEDGRAVGHHAQDHLPELVEGQVVQRLTWKQGEGGGRDRIRWVLRGTFHVGKSPVPRKPSPTARLEATRSTIWKVFILGQVRVGRQSPPPHLYISSVGLWYCSVSCSHSHVATHTPKCTRTLPEPT